jgi:MFS family permease
MYWTTYRRYVTTLLFSVYILNQLDRAVFSVLMEPIRRQLSLSDTQLGFLAGPALVVLYASIGMPVARWADRSSRVAIMSCAVAVWSLITSLTAMVSDFGELSLARIAVGVGEAGFSAIAISVIGDYERDASRARAVSNFMLAIPIAALLSNLIGGWVNQFYGWRPAFLITGLPGVLLAVLMRATLKEPARRPTPAAPDSSRCPPLRVVFATLWHRPGLRHLLIAQALANVVLQAVSTWASAFFIRAHHLSTGELGSWLAISSAGSFSGIWLSGFLAAKFATRTRAINARLMALAGIAVAPIALLTLWCPFKYLALVSYLLLTIPMYYFLGPTQALVQELVGPRMRATAASIVIMVQLLAGGVIGTQLVGLVSDVLMPLTGDATAALRWAMTLGSMVTWWAVMHFFVAGRHIERETVPVEPG